MAAGWASSSSPSVGSASGSFFTSTIMFSIAPVFWSSTWMMAVGWFCLGWLVLPGAVLSASWRVVGLGSQAEALARVQFLQQVPPRPHCHPDLAQRFHCQRNLLFRAHLSFSSTFTLLCFSSILPFYTIWTSTIISMPCHGIPTCKCFPTFRTDEGCRDKVGVMIAFEVHVEELFLAEGLVAVAASVRLLPSVGALVHDHVPLLSTSVITLVALKALLVLVRLLMLDEGIALMEHRITVTTLLALLNIGMLLSQVDT